MRGDVAVGAAEVGAEVHRGASPLPFTVLNQDHAKHAVN
jgi:hypothetical protein